MRAVESFGSLLADWQTKHFTKLKLLFHGSVVNFFFIFSNLNVVINNVTEDHRFGSVVERVK